MDNTRRLSGRVAALIALCLGAAISLALYGNRSLAALATRAESTLEPANSTMGFGAVVAVSHATSSRRKNLIFAANLTGIDLTIPDQPVWTDRDLQSFRSAKGSRISKGSALAWMGHLNALKWFLSTTHSTAIILEDDVDFSIHLLRTQIPLLAATFRTLTDHQNSTPSHPGSTYWGPLTWELLHLGHCGDYPPSPLPSPHTTFTDPTLPPHSSLHPPTAAFLQSAGVPDRSRLIHPSYWPLCTFGYGVTRASAARLLSTFSSEGEGGCQAYDVRILEACRDHQWACWSVNPELLRHVEGGSEIAAQDGAGGVTEGDGRNGRSGGETSTPNIACGARQRGWFSEDRGVLEWLRAWVGRGVCLESQMEGDLGRWP